LREVALTAVFVGGVDQSTVDVHTSDTVPDTARKRRMETNEEQQVMVAPRPTVTSLPDTGV